MEYKQLYIWSHNQARQSGETEFWHESHNENCRCARAIEKAIATYYKDNKLDKTGAKKMIADYGFERVNWVLANTVQLSHSDGRYSEENKRWAMARHIPYDEHYQREKFSVEKHPGLVNLFIDQVRAEWNALGLYDYKDCYDNSRSELNYTGQIVVLDPTIFKDEYKQPERQLFLAKFGNGCRPESLGTKVYGHHLHNGKECYYRRADILGVMKLDLVPDWAKEKAVALLHKAEKSEEPQEEKEAKTEAEDEEEQDESIGQIQS